MTLSVEPHVVPKGGSSKVAKVGNLTTSDRTHMLLLCKRSIWMPGWQGVTRGGGGCTVGLQYLQRHNIGTHAGYRYSGQEATGNATSDGAKQTSKDFLYSLCDFSSWLNPKAR